MFLKILILTGAAGLMCLFVMRAARGVVSKPDTSNKDGAGNVRKAKVKDLVKCPHCGIFLPAERTCDCRDAA